jgi:predicted dehydrogenase
MSTGRIGVGIVGANPDEGWARLAHVPALAALPDLELVAVATSRAQSARASAERFGVRHAFTDAADLAQHPDVDLVVVAVKVSMHDTAVRAAIDAGKAVLCEWALARDAAEAAALARLAAARGVRGAVGLQGRFSPVIHHARDLIADGYVGSVLSVSVLVLTGPGAGYIERQRYRFDPANGATTLAIVGGHTLDTIASLVGEIEHLSAELQVQRPRVRFIDSGEELEVTTPDQLLLHGRLRHGGALSLHVQGEKRNGTRALIEIAGSDGDLRIESARENAMPGLQLQELRLLGVQGRGAALEELAIPASAQCVDAGLTQPALNVAQLYAQLASDLVDGTSTVPDFQTALRLHLLLDAVAASAANGSRRVSADA